MTDRNFNQRFGTIAAAATGWASINRVVDHDPDVRSRISGRFWPWGAQAEDATLALGGLKTGLRLFGLGRGVGWRSIGLLVAVFPEEKRPKPDYQASAGFGRVQRHASPRGAQKRCADCDTLLTSTQRTAPDPGSMVESSLQHSK